MKRMLVNATQQEELRVAMVDGQKLYDLDIEVPSREQRKANIYKGRITRVEPSLEAAFVDYGAQRHGFLPLKEISPEYYVREPESGERVQIRDVLRENQEIVVQVEKEERGTKGAALTTYVSLAGRFLVLMPNNPRAGGVSRRITGEDRDIVRQSLEELAPPEGMGCIVRTAGVGRSTEELRWDLDYLLRVWESILGVVVSRPAPFLIYQEGNAIVRALRDYYSSEIGEILIDDPKVYQEALDFMERVLPQSVRKLKLYDDPTVPLFTRFQIESQIESAFNHKVQLPSGGSIVIDHTEALTAIDINSARSTKGEDIEDTAFNTNLEAADEVARQLRIRDLGGLVVVDFIDMGPHRNQREVENRLRDAVKQDRARIQIGRISRFGLLELSRQRLRPSLEESTQSVCPRCNGTGNVRSVESLALAILRLVGEEARKDRTAKVIAQLPIEVANYLLNEKRDWVTTVQERNAVQILLIGNPDMDTPNYAIKRVRDDEALLPENAATSYKMIEPKEDPSLAYEEIKRVVKAEEAAVAGVLPATPAPQPVEPPPVKRSESSLWQRMFGWMNGGGNASSSDADDEAPTSRERRKAAPARGRESRGGGQGERRSRGERDRGGQRRGRGGRSEGGAQAKSGRGDGGAPARSARGDGGQERPARGDGGGQARSGRGDGGNGRGAKAQREQSGSAGKGRDSAAAQAQANKSGGGPGQPEPREPAPSGAPTGASAESARSGDQGAQSSEQGGAGQSGAGQGSSRRRSRGRRRGGSRSGASSGNANANANANADANAAGGQPENGAVQPADARPKAEQDAAPQAATATPSDAGARAAAEAEAWARAEAAATEGRRRQAADAGSARAEEARTRDSEDRRATAREASAEAPAGEAGREASPDRDSDDRAATQAESSAPRRESAATQAESSAPRRESLEDRSSSDRPSPTSASSEPRDSAAQPGNGGEAEQRESGGHADARATSPKQDAAPAGEPPGKEASA